MAARRSVSRYRYSTIIRMEDGTEYYADRPAFSTQPRADDRYYDVRAGDTLQSIAYALLGDARYWWVVADFNDILDPFAELVPGTTLRLPSYARLWTEVLR